MCKFEGIITEMHSVILNNHFEKNESNKNNTHNSDEDSTTMEERENKGKKDNAYSQLMTGQNKSTSIDHFDGYMQWIITKFLSEAINMKHSVLQK